MYLLSPSGFGLRSVTYSMLCPTQEDDSAVAKSLCMTTAVMVLCAALKFMAADPVSLTCGMDWLHTGVCYTQTLHSFERIF